MSTIRPTNLRCEHRVDPLGIDTPRPRLSWWLEGVDRAARGLRQTAYRVVVSRSRGVAEAGDDVLWDSGTIRSEEQTHVEFAGATLSSAQQVWWKVRVRDADNVESAWSEPATWTMGLLNADDWRAHWITATDGGTQQKPLPIFRRAFSIDRPVARAIVFVCGLGHLELRLNGRVAGENVLDPGWTNYVKSCLYVTHDVTSLLRSGENAIAVMLGNGMYKVTGGRYRKFKASFGPPKLILQLHVDYDDGSRDVIVTDDTWKTAPGPTTFSCIYGGEDYDARLQQPGWDSAGFDDSPWPRVVATTGPGGSLVARSAPPARVLESFAPVKTTPLQDGITLYDLGQNFSGWPRISMRGGRDGATVKLVTGELLDEHGRVTQKNTGSPVSFSFTSAGAAEEWRPRFSYTGFRYVEAHGDVGAIADLRGDFVHSSTSVVGHFRCSNALLNRIHDLITAAIRSNMQSVLTDCPHREKLGWLEQAHLMGPAVMFNFDVPLLFTKICRDMREAQHSDGCVPTIAPEYVTFKDKYADFSNSPEWGSAAVIVPWLIYQQYGDRRVLEENYDMMRRYVEYLHTRERDGIIDFGLGDWYDVGPGEPGHSKLTSKALTGTAIYYQDVTILHRVAVLLERQADAERYEGWATCIRDAFNARFFDARTNRYDRGSQTANAMALALGLVRQNDRVGVLNALIADIRAHGNHVTAGDIGFRYVLQALADADRSDVIFDLLSRTDPPSYGAQLARGATTLTEAWDANPKNSQNHLMLGHAELWFYQSLAGIQLDLSRPRAERIVIQPHVVGDVTWADASYDSIVGRIGSRWERSKGELKQSVEIPVNSTATVYLPTGPVTVGSGSHQFESNLPEK